MGRSAMRRAGAYPTYKIVLPSFRFLADMGRSTFEVNAAQLCSVSEIAPKSPSLCVNRSPIRIGIRASTRAITARRSKGNCNVMLSLLLSFPGGVLRGLQPPPPFGKFSNLSGYPCLSLFHTKNNITNYNISSSPVDHYKKSLAIPFLDSLIIQMQDRFVLSSAIGYSK